MVSWKRVVWALCLSSVLGCSNSDVAGDICPAGVVAGQNVECTCTDQRSGAQRCQPDGRLSECQCAAGAIHVDAGGGGHAGSGPLPGLDGSTGDSDASTGMLDAATMSDAGVDAGATDVRTDGTQGAACTAHIGCADGLSCYVPTNAAVGICTASCTLAGGDCAMLQGAVYSCNGAGAFGPGACMIKCSGPNDPTCPDNMVCEQISAAAGALPAVHECAYETTRVGHGDVALWQKCDTAGDCMGDQRCFGRGTMMIAGTTYTGFCTQSCQQNSDCTQQPPNGDIDPTCGDDGKCMLDCAAGATCPSDMTCISDVTIGGAQRCVYTK
jgi:hypothetical protein